ncbi:MAG: GntR family transcriptional regulator [bacterium]|nr:GntR family transcriptional regulator [bacterium]
MLGTLRIDARTPVPLWRQIEDGVRRLIASQSIGPGTPMLSVRELAFELSVNPATVAKAYQRLCEDGVLTVRRGEGTYVADRPRAEVEADREELLDSAAREFAKVAVTIGANRMAALEAMARVWGDVAEEAE